MTNREILDDLAAAQEAVRKAHAAVIHRGTLPAPVMDEDAIVAALKRDPGMAGRVMSAYAMAVTPYGVGIMAQSAKATCACGDSEMRHRTLQYLAVALASASYRGA